MEKIKITSNCFITDYNRKTWDLKQGEVRDDLPEEVVARLFRMNFALKASATDVKSVVDLEKEREARTRAEAEERAAEERARAEAVMPVTPVPEKKDGGTGEGDPDFSD